jgi:hypothetical protein
MAEPQPPPDPDTFPHRLLWVGDTIVLITDLGEKEDRRPLGKSSTLQAAYLRWKHLRDVHGTSHANVFLWGILTGMQVSVIGEWEHLIHRGWSDPEA